MRMRSAALILSLSISITAHAQPAPAAQQTQQTVPAAAPAAPADGASQESAATAPAVTASSLLQPALIQSQSTLSSLKVDHWKKGSVRDEAEQNVNALLRDLQSNLPPLMAAADAEPASLSRALPLIKHLDAFYDVLLRVEEASRVSAPSEQISALQQTLLDVNKSRIAYDDQLQAEAAGQEKQVFDLQTALRTQKEELTAEQAKTAAAEAKACKAATPAHRKRKTTANHTAAKPTTPPSQ